jgi:hypothetical protein
MTRKQFKELPMPVSVIKRVEATALKEKEEKTITFSDQSGETITDLYDTPNDDTIEGVAGVDDTGNYNNNNDEAPRIAMEQPQDNANDTTIDEAAPEIVMEQPHDTSAEEGGAAEEGITGVPAEITGVTAEEGITCVAAETTGVPAEEGETTGVTSDHDTAGVTHQVEDNDDNPLSIGPPRSEDSDNDDEDEDEDRYDSYHPSTMAPLIQRVHRLRPRKAREYSHMFSHATVMHHAMAQYSLKKGLRKFQKVGEAAVSKELKQLHTRDTFAPRTAKVSATHRSEGRWNH